MLQGNDPLHSALDVALVSLRTSKAIVGGVLGSEIPCGGARYVGSGLSKYPMRANIGKTDNHFNATINHISLNAFQKIVRLCNFIKES